MKQISIVFLGVITEVSVSEDTNIEEFVEYFKGEKRKEYVGEFGEKKTKEVEMEDERARNYRVDRV